jgi:hypothetical protein
MPNGYMVLQSGISQCKYYVIILWKIKTKLLLIFDLPSIFFDMGTVKHLAVTT